MNNSTIFKLAHKLTKATIQRGDDYSVNFSAALKIIYAEQKMSLEDKLVAIGGKLWEGYGKRRIYFNEFTVAKMQGYDFDTYKTGNISAATLNGKKISNSEMYRVLDKLGRDKFYYDLDSETFETKNGNNDWFANVVNNRIAA